MKKFYVQYDKGKPSILEVEIEMLTALEDISVSFLPAGEYKARVLNPKSFYEKEGAKLVPPIYHSHAFLDSIEDAKIQAKRGILCFLERNFIKNKIDFSKEEVDNFYSTLNVEIEKLSSAIEVIML